MYQNDPAKVLTGEVRLSYVHLIEPRTNKPGDDPKYSATLLIPKTDFATKADIDASIQAAAQDAVSKVWNGAAPPQLRVPIYDGDGVRQSGEPFGEECRGHWVMSASTFNKPQVVGIQNINQELPPREVYSGMYARVTIRFFGYSNSGNKGIGCGLGNVMKTRDGEPLSGSASAASDFAGIGQPGGAAADFANPAQGVQPPVAPAPAYGAPVAAPAPAAPPAYPGAYPPPQPAPAPAPAAPAPYGYPAPAPAPAAPAPNGNPAPPPTPPSGPPNGINPITGQPM